MENFTKDQIIEYLKTWKNIKDAIANIHSLGKNLPYVYDNDEDKILFCFNTEKVIQSEFKTKLCAYAKTEGWANAESCEDMEPIELLNFFNLSVKIKK